MICGHLQIQVMLSELHTDQKQALDLGWGGLNQIIDWDSNILQSSQSCYQSTYKLWSSCTT